MPSRMLLALCLLAVLPTGAGAQQDKPADNGIADFQKDFAAAYNRGDLDAMTAAFTANAIRVTPSGIFQGRDAIRRGFQDALNLGLHDYSVRRVVSRSEGSFVFNAGEWQAKVGDQPFRGFYTAVLVREGDQTRIMEETVTVAAPWRGAGPADAENMNDNPIGGNKPAKEASAKKPSAKPHVGLSLQRLAAEGGITGFLRNACPLIVYASAPRFRLMQNDYDPQREAEMAMRQAVATDGLERQRWLRVAQAWSELARTRSFWGEKTEAA